MINFYSKYGHDNVLRIYFATDLLSEKYGRKEANRAVILGAFANVAVMLTLVLSTLFLPSNVADSAEEVHDAISTLAVYSPIFVFGSITAYLISQLFDVWIFHKIKSVTGEKMLWLRNNLSTLMSQALDTFLYTFVWVLQGNLTSQLPLQSLFQNISLSLALR